MDVHTYTHEVVVSNAHTCWVVVWCVTPQYCVCSQQTFLEQPASLSVSRSSSQLDELMEENIMRDDFSTTATTGLSSPTLPSQSLSCLPPSLAWFCLSPFLSPSLLLHVVYTYCLFHVHAVFHQFSDILKKLEILQKSFNEVKICAFLAMQMSVWCKYSCSSMTTYHCMPDAIAY